MTPGIPTMGYRAFVFKEWSEQVMSLFGLRDDKLEAEKAVRASVPMNVVPLQRRAYEPKHRTDRRSRMPWALPPSERFDYQPKHLRLI